MNAVIIQRPGGPEALHLAELPVPVPGPRDVVVQIAYSGVNFIDVYHRIGLYPVPLPATLGTEASGTVSAVGAEVTEVSVGDRVAYAVARGSYAEFAMVPASAVVPVPAGVGLDLAAALMLQGMTAHYLTKSTFPLQPGQTCLVHAAAGGTGALLVQMAKHVGARVIGTVSTAEKEAIARAAGADHVIRYTEQDFESETRQLTDGRGVDVVYDSVGKTTFDKSLNVLRHRGMLVLFGASSGPVPPFDPAVLNPKGSLYLTRPSLGHYVSTREELVWRATEVLDLAARGALTVRIDRSYPLADVADAHRTLEGRGTTGKLLVKVS